MCWIEIIPQLSRMRARTAVPLFLSANEPARPFATHTDGVYDVDSILIGGF